MLFLLLLPLLNRIFDTIMKKISYKPILLGVLCISVLASCGSDDDVEDNSIDKEVFDPSSSLNTIFDGKIFSIPSPVQTAYLIKRLDLSFDESILNDDANVSEYVSEYQQALNLGVYGTDLGYSTLYDQKNTSLKYLSSVEKLTSQLGLDAAFDSSFISRFERNSGNEDSMIMLMSDAFKKSDNFLKNANRKTASALILTGGWIESIYIACQLNDKKDSPEIKRRIGEQKQSLSSIIELLQTYNKDGINDNLIAELIGLKISFDKIILNYEYAAPETDEENKLTTFNHSLEVEFTEEVMSEITEKLNNIRNSIIKA